MQDFEWILSVSGSDGIFAHAVQHRLAVFRLQ